MCKSLFFYKAEPQFETLKQSVKIRLSFSSVKFDASPCFPFNTLSSFD